MEFSIKGSDKKISNPTSSITKSMESIYSSGHEMKVPKRNVHWSLQFGFASHHFTGRERKFRGLITGSSNLICGFFWCNHSTSLQNGWCNYQNYLPVGWLFIRQEVQDQTTLDHWRHLLANIMNLLVCTATISLFCERLRRWSNWYRRIFGDETCPLTNERSFILKALYWS